MNWTPLLLGLLAHYTGSVSSSELSQPPSLSGRLGEVVRLSCRGDDIGGRYSHWYQQKQGQAPRLVIYKDSNRPSEIPDRFSGSNSGDTAMLTIRNAQAEDEATYYCLSSYSHSDIDLWGTETQTSCPSHHSLLQAQNSRKLSNEHSTLPLISDQESSNPQLSAFRP